MEEMEHPEGLVDEVDEEEDESSLLLRKSRILVADTESNNKLELSNGKVSEKTNGHAVTSALNGDDEDDEAVEPKTEPAKTENLVLYHKDEGRQIVKDDASPNLKSPEISVQGQLENCKSPEEIESVEAHQNYRFPKEIESVEVHQNFKSSEEIESVEIHQNFKSSEEIERVEVHQNFKSSEEIESVEVHQNFKSSKEIESVEVHQNHKSPGEIESVEVHQNFKSSEEIESVEVERVKGDEFEVTEFDVEKVLQKQNTHDLYCPNCNSCITKRVILRKRKRGVRISDDEAKRNKIEAALKPNLVTESSSTNQVEGVGLGADELPTLHDDEADREPDIFRCLSCFSFFIPNGNGFKLFRIFGDKSVNENVRGEPVTNTKKNWFTSMFAFNKQETAVGQDSALQTDASGSEVRTPLLSELGDQTDRLASRQKGQVLAHSNLQTDAHTSDIRTPLLSKLGDQTDRLPSGKNAPVVAYSNLQTDVHGSEARVPSSSELGAENGQLSLGQKAQVLTHTTGVVGNSQNNEVLESRVGILSFPRQEPVNGKAIIGLGDKTDEATKEKIDALMEQFDVHTGERLEDSNYSNDVHVNHGNTLSAPERTKFTNGKSFENSVSFSKGGLKFLISSNQGNVNPPKSDEHDVSDQTLSDKEPLPLSTSPFKASDTDSSSSNSADVPHTVTEHRVGSWILTESAFNNNSATLSIKETGKDTVITIDAHPDELSQTLQGINAAAETASALQSGTPTVISSHGRTEKREDFQLEVVKSLVYGGLGELIASLSVVSSAAGGGAATLNILALAMANLIGGLFIMYHNLWELRNDRLEKDPNRVSDPAPKQRNRYKEVLGRRKNFIYHALFATVSYLIFGLLPPVAYGFSFSKSNDKELKLLVVAVVSLLCITLLAVGRAYVQTPRKRYLKTIVTFFILGFTVSGVSYAAGVFVERLLEKLHVFPPNSGTNLLLSEMQPADNAWASY